MTTQSPIIAGPFRMSAARLLTRRIFRSGLLPDSWQRQSTFDFQMLTILFDGVAYGMLLFVLAWGWRSPWA